MRIRAAVLHQPRQPLVIEDVELVSPREDEVLVRVAAAGVCRSDVRLADGELGGGRWPMVMGHEGAGVVEAVGAAVTHVAPGDHVGFCIVPACRACEECRAGRHHLCIPAGENGLRGVLMDGTSRLSLPDETTLQHALMTACFAERTVVPAAGAVRLPRELPLWQASLLGCGVVTAFGAVRNAARVQRGESAAVIGCGGVGLQVIAALRLAGANPIVAVDLDAAKLELALDRGATDAVESGPAVTAARVAKLAGRGADQPPLVPRGKLRVIEELGDGVHSGVGNLRRLEPGDDLFGRQGGEGLCDDRVERFVVLDSAGVRAEARDGLASAWPGVRDAWLGGSA